MRTEVSDIKHRLHGRQCTPKPRSMTNIAHLPNFIFATRQITLQAKYCKPKLNYTTDTAKQNFITWQTLFKVRYMTYY